MEDSVFPHEYLINITNIGSEARPICVALGVLHDQLCVLAALLREAKK